MRCKGTAGKYTERIYIATKAPRHKDEKEFMKGRLKNRPFLLVLGKT
jgi:hypothetical protein